MGYEYVVIYRERANSQSGVGAIKLVRLRIWTPGCRRVESWYINHTNREVLELEKAVYRRVLMDDIALRNLLVADGLSLKIDFAQFTILPGDTDMATAD